MRLLLLSLLIACKAEPKPKMPVADDTGSASDACEALGLPIRPFEHAADDDSLYATAADFTVELADGGSWTLSEEWTGCDTVMIIQDTPYQSQGWPVPLWDRDVPDLMDRLPMNTQLIFVSELGSRSEREAALSGLKETFDAVIAGMSAEDATWWANRIHYSPTRSISIDGWLGDALSSPRFPIAIDRMQRIRYVGSLADYRRYDNGRGWFEPNLSMAANEPVYFNFEAEREARLAAEDATIVTIFDGAEHGDPGWAGTRGTVDIELPDAATMATFDTLEYDLYLGCVGEGEFGTCPAWDYLVYLYLCDVPVEDNAHTDETCQPHVPGVTEVLEEMGTCSPVDADEDTGADAGADSDTGVEDFEGDEPGECSDGADNDRDGLYDCDDPDCFGAPDCADADADSETTDSGSEDSGSTDTGETTVSCMTDADCATGETCQGYIAPVDGIDEIAADILSCDCSEPDATIYESTQSCNGEGSGYNDCSCSCNDEVGRWITTYHREGRWVHDASPLLPKLRPGGKQRFAFYTQQNYEIHLDFRLMNNGKSTAPEENLPLFNGGAFNTTYNDREPIELDIPADAAKVELAYVISGHGQEQPGNCAEFCVTTHHFFVNGTEHEVALSDASVQEGCMDQVDQGTVPNQFGTWWYGRSNWCPGKEVQVKTIDITADVDIGAENTFTYEGYYNGRPYEVGGARIQLSSWIIVSR